MSRRDFFQIFCMFYLQCITRKCAKEKNFDIQRNTRVASGGQFTSNRLSNDHNISGIFLCGYLSFLGFLGIFAHHDTRFWSKETIFSNQSGKSSYYCGSIICDLGFVIKTLKGETFVIRYVWSWVFAGYFHCIFPTTEDILWKIPFSQFSGDSRSHQFLWTARCQGLLPISGWKYFCPWCPFSFFSKALPYFTILTQIIHFHLIKMQQGIQCTLVATITAFTICLCFMMAEIIFASTFVHDTYNLDIVNSYTWNNSRQVTIKFFSRSPLKIPKWTKILWTWTPGPWQRSTLAKIILH